MVVTTPAGVTSRIRLLFASATKRLPEPSTATPPGPLNRAALPVPSVDPADASPAKVVNAYGVA